MRNTCSSVPAHSVTKMMRQGWKAEVSDNSKWSLHRTFDVTLRCTGVTSQITTDECIKIQVLKNCEYFLLLTVNTQREFDNLVLASVSNFSMRYTRFCDVTQTRDWQETLETEARELPKDLLRPEKHRRNYYSKLWIRRKLWVNEIWRNNGCVGWGGERRRGILRAMSEQTQPSHQHALKIFSQFSNRAGMERQKPSKSCMNMSRCY